MVNLTLYIQIREKNSVIKNNTAPNCGGVHSESGPATLTISDTSIIGNTASRTNRGAGLNITAISPKIFGKVVIKDNYNNSNRDFM